MGDSRTERYVRYTHALLNGLLQAVESQPFFFTCDTRSWWKEAILGAGNRGESEFGLSHKPA
jgi:hypothetical protein